ncbi:SDR family NAD(P)-dependent oxidoreductase [Phenylobacterium sp. LjRoot219]|uniref:SDR family NAD(P)-dependent oxidoreductase n=1 Tax=Phenylobacterium sp. LjRoot219 TaxID=3342283 RepID=UPI003ED13CAE
MSFAERYGPWAVIAGASEGTGREFARQIAAQGLNCILIARREGPLKELAEQIRAESGVECVTASVDLAKPDAAEQIAAVAGDREVGLYVNNAGADPNGKRFLDNDLQNWVDLAQRNVMTTLKTAYLFAGPMRARGRGGVLLVNSGACYGGSSFMATYSASKAFDLCFAEGLWAELRNHGVDVLSLVLGQTDTPAYRTLLAEKGLPLPTNWASPVEVAKVGLAQLPHGPVYNWGQTNDVAGYAPNSPDQRRARVLMIEQHSRSTFGDD